MHTAADVHQEPCPQGEVPVRTPLLPARPFFPFPLARRMSGIPRPSGERIVTMQNPNTRPDLTLKDLLASLDAVSKMEKAPTPKALREGAGKPVAELPGLQVYQNGYAVYENSSGRSVFRAAEGLSFTYCFQPARPGENSPLPTSFTIPRKVLEELPWYIPLTLVGDYRVEYNGRIHSRECSLNLEDPGMLDNLLSEKEYSSDSFGFGFSLGENPESTLIRRETNEELLSALTGRQREVFALYYLEGCNQYEIADMLGMSRPAVSRLLRRALDRLEGSHLLDPNRPISD